MTIQRAIVLVLIAVAIPVFLLTGCGTAEQEADAVETGTYTGTLTEVVPEETEIYVETEDGKTIELYFNEETNLVDANGDSIPFDTLSKGDRVEVDVERVGQRNDPLRVQRLE